MKSLVALLLACQILGSSLLPGFGIDHFTQLFSLVRPDQQHRQTESDLNFPDFRVHHHGADSAHQKHPSYRHHNLPTTGHSVPVFVVTSPRLIPTTISRKIPEGKKVFGHKADLYSFLTAFALINPPDGW